MTVAVKARGTLRFGDRAALDEAMSALDGDDEYVVEVALLVGEGSVLTEASIRLLVDGSLTNMANLEFQDWLSDLADLAVAGHLDTWQEDFGDAFHIRLRAGGEESEVPGPMARAGDR